MASFVRPQTPPIHRLDQQPRGEARSRSQDTREHELELERMQLVTDARAPNTWALRRPTQSCPQYVAHGMREYARGPAHLDAECMATAELGGQVGGLVGFAERAPTGRGTGSTDCIDLSTVSMVSNVVHVTTESSTDAKPTFYGAVRPMDVASSRQPWGQGERSCQGGGSAQGGRYARGGGPARGGGYARRSREEAAAVREGAADWGAWGAAGGVPLDSNCTCATGAWTGVNRRVPWIGPVDPVRLDAYPDGGVAGKFTVVVVEDAGHDATPRVDGRRWEQPPCSRGRATTYPHGIQTISRIERAATKAKRSSKGRYEVRTMTRFRPPKKTEQNPDGRRRVVKSDPEGHAAFNDNIEQEFDGQTPTRHVSTCGGAMSPYIHN